MIQAVIFDLDGVLVSTDALHYRAWKRLADELGIIGFTEKDAQRQRGVSRMASLEVLLEACAVSYDEDEKIALANRKNEYYVKMLADVDGSAVLPGARETVAYLKTRGIRLAVGSASKNAPLILEKTGLAPHLDAVSCGLDVTRSKPDPQVFLVAAEKLGVDPAYCLVVEDAHAGIEAAKNGGMYAFAVGAAKDCALADWCAADMRELLACLPAVLSETKEVPS